MVKYPTPRRIGVNTGSCPARSSTRARPGRAKAAETSAAREVARKSRRDVDTVASFGRGPSHSRPTGATRPAWPHAGAPWVGSGGRCVTSVTRPAAGGQGRRPREGRAHRCGTRVRGALALDSGACRRELGDVRVQPLERLPGAFHGAVVLHDVIPLRLRLEERPEGDLRAAVAIREGDRRLEGVRIVRAAALPVDEPLPGHDLLPLDPVR